MDARPGRAPLAREAALSAGAAGTLAALLAWLGPPGSDLAAHAYQRALFLQHGFALWNNFWYAGRYSFVTYSLIYYPLAAWLGIKLLAVATVATAALAFAVVLGREWGPTARWSSRTFSVAWAGIILSAAFPFALGAALALLALWAVQAGFRWRFAGLALLTLAASPLAFLLLALVLVGLGVGSSSDRRRLAVPAAIVALIGTAEAVLWRLFPDGGHYPFSLSQLTAALLFCAVGAILTWRVDGSRVYRWVFVVYAAACLGSFAVPSDLGENIARLRYVALPVAVLTLSLRRWRPLPVCLIALALAISWNTSPLVASYLAEAADPTTKVSYWQPAINYLNRHLTPSYRTEVVDTDGHWGAVYLPRAGIPIARGWFRQNDFPQNRLLYQPLGAKAYLNWLRSLGVRYVLLTDADPDYSARAEAALLRSGHSGLQAVLRGRHITIFSVPAPQPLVTGPAPARVSSLTETRIDLELALPGTYRVAVRYSPYWESSTGCLGQGPDSMIRLNAPSGFVSLRFQVDAGRALAAFAGRAPAACPR